MPIPVLRSCGIMRRLQVQDGGALVELALALPLLAVLVIGTLDFGRIAYTAMAVQGAARAGAEYGIQTTTLAFDTAGIQAAATASATDIPGFSSSTSAQCKCWNGTSESALSPCTGTCAGTVRMYVTVTGTATFHTVSRYPGIPSTVVISRTVKMRAQ